MDDEVFKSMSNKFEDYDVNLTNEERIREVFEKFDEDGSGAISALELQKVLTKPGMENSLLDVDQVKAIIQ